MMRCSWCFFKQRTADEMRMSDWSSDVCSSELLTADTAGLISVLVMAGLRGDVEHHQSAMTASLLKRFCRTSRTPPLVIYDNAPSQHSFPLSIDTSHILLKSSIFIVFGWRRPICRPALHLTF